MLPESVNGNVGVATSAISYRRRGLRGWLRSLTLWGLSDFRNNLALQSRQSSLESNYGFYKTKRCLSLMKALTFQTQGVTMIALRILRGYSIKRKTMLHSRNLYSMPSIEISTLNRTLGKRQRNNKMKRTILQTCLEVWHKIMCKSRILDAF